MWLRSIVQLAVIAFTVLGAAPIAVCGILESLNISLLSKPQPSGEVRYGLRIYASGASQTITDASGQEYLSYIGFYRVENLTEAEALSHIIGTWTITARPFGPPTTPVETHTFTVEPFSLENLFTVPPTITAPAQGQVVDRQFNVDFQWPSGTIPPTSRSATWSHSRSIDSVNFDVQLNKLSFPVTVSLEPGETRGDLTFSVGTVQSLSQFLSPVTATTSNPYWEYNPILRFVNYSAERTVIVSTVPEPGTLALWCIASAWILAHRRQRPAK